MLNRNRENAANSVSHEQLAALRATKVNAVPAAVPAVGSFPTVLYFGGLNADINSNFILAEFLASHGYVFASISLLGVTDKQTSQARTPSDLDAVVRDMEFALQILGESTNADRTKLGVVGHSLGGIEATMFALRNGNVSAVIGLDGTYGFKGSAAVLTNSYGFSPAKMRSSFLDLRRAQGEQQADLDLEPVRSFRFSDRSLVTLTKMHHSDFTSFANVAAAFQVPINPEYLGTGWNRETGRRGYENVCQIILSYLDEKVKGGSPGPEKFRQAVQRAGGNLTHHDASYAPLSPREVVALAGDAGLDAVKTILKNISGDQAVSACVDASSFNSCGYDLLGERRAKDAMVVFQIVAWAHPTSANAHDSLADGHLALGDKEGARKAILRAIELAPTDSTIGAESKASFIKEEKGRLEQIK